MAFNIAYIANKFLPTKSIETLGKQVTFEAWVDGGLPASSGEVVAFETTKPFILDRMEFAGGDAGNIRIRIYANVNGAWQARSFQVLLKNGIRREATLTFYTLSQNPSDLFDLKTYDDNSKSYKFTLAKPLHFANGVKISIENIAAVPTFGAIIGDGREVS